MAKSAIAAIFLCGCMGVAGYAQAPAVPVAPAVPLSQTAATPASPQPSLTVLEDTPIRVLTTSGISSRSASAGTSLLFIVSEDVKVGDRVAIPRGAKVRGEVVKTKGAGVLTGSPQLTLKLVSLELPDRSYPIYSYQLRVIGTSKTGPTKTKAATGAAVGAVAGAIAGSRAVGGATSGPGPAVGIVAGMAAGAGVGTAVAAASPGPEIRIPSEAEIEFSFASPLTVPPVSAGQAALLSQGLHPGGPVLYVRGETP